MRIDGHHKIYMSRSQTRSMSAYEPIGDAHGGAAYGERNDPVTAAVGIAGSTLASGYMGARAAKSAADQQAASQAQAMALQKEMFDIQQEQQRPYREAGYTALGDIAGMKPYLTQQFTPQDFAAGIDPGYAWRLQQGQRAAQQAANVGGGMMSGNTLAGLQDYTQGQASQEYGNAFNRFQTQRSNIYNTLASIAGLGQTATGASGAGALATGQAMGQNIANIGSAQAGGTVGAANALAGGVQGAGNAYYMSNLLRGSGQSPIVNPSSGGYTPSGGVVGPVDYSVASAPAASGGLGLRLD
jgi:hypothetical protein